MRILCDDMYPFGNASTPSVGNICQRDRKRFSPILQKTLKLKLKVTKTLYRGKPELDMTCLSSREMGNINCFR